MRSHGWRLAKVLSLALGILGIAGPSIAQPTPPQIPPPAQAVAVPSPAGGAIRWRVANRFRLFDASSADAVAVRTQAETLLDRLAGSPDLKSAYSSIYPLLQARDLTKPGALSPAYTVNLYAHTHYRRGPGRYDRDYIAPSEQLITTWWDGTLPEGARCSWSVNGREQASETPCRNSVLLHLPYPKGSFAFEGVVAVTSGGAVLGQIIVRTHDTLVVSMGDSFAAGEGSPDRPADLSRLQIPNPYVGHKPYLWWLDSNGQSAKAVLPESASADWWSLECHRSLFSPHVLAALKMAADDPYDSLTYLSYACAGASVLDGLLTPQAEPPGLERIDRFAADHPDAETPEGRAQVVSQLEMAVTDLCAQAITKDDYPFDRRRIPNWTTILTRNAGGSFPGVPHCSAWIRRPNAIFLTIGGNDVGFAGLGRWALTPSVFFDATGHEATADDVLSAIAAKIAGDRAWNGMAFVCPWEPYGQTWISWMPILGAQIGKDPRCNAFLRTNWGARHLIEVELPYLLATAQEFFAKSGISADGLVIQETYPDPLHDEAGRLCGSNTATFNSTERQREPWLADESQVPPEVSKFSAVEIYVRRDGAQAVDEVAFTGAPRHASLASTLKAAEGPSWRVAASPPEYATHGVCATTTKLPDPFKGDWTFLRWATASPTLGAWAPADVTPTTWAPYAPRGRWLRTADDSLLTEADADANGRLLDESLSGTIHPTAEGQAAVADQLLARLRH